MGVLPPPLYRPPGAVNAQPTVFGVVEHLHPRELNDLVTVFAADANRVFGDLDPAVPEIGDELAAGRAMAALAHHLLDIAADDIEAFVAGR